MVGISLQDDVKKSFANVKEDILNVKRSVNRELLAIEEIGGRLQTFVVKDEFYSFVKRLGERLDAIDDKMEAYLGYEDEIKSVDAKVNGLSKKLSRQDDMSGEVKEVRALRGKLEALEGSVVSARKFNEEIGKLLADVSSIKAVMLTGKSLESLKAKLADAEKRAERLEKSIPSKADVSGSIAAVEEVRESIRRVELDSQKRLEEIEKTASKRLEEVSGSLRVDVEGIRASSVDKAAFEKSVKELKKETASIRNVLESSVSEIDFSDYVTRKELGKKLLAVEELDADIGKSERNIAEIESALQSLRRETASIDDVRMIGSDVKDVSKSLDALKAVIEKANDSSQKRFAQELEQAKAKFDKEISRLRDDFEGKLERLKRADKEKAPAREGMISRIGKSFADFFREDEEQHEKKPRAKPAPSVSELLKEEEKKKPRKDTGFGGLYLIWIAIFILVSVLFVLWFSNRPAAPEGEINGSVVIEEVDNVAEEPVIIEEVPAVVEEADVVEDVPVMVKNVNVSQEETAQNASEEVPEADVVAAPAVPRTLEYCRENYECKPRGDGTYGFDCYVDDDGECRCFVTDAEGCGIVEEMPSEELTPVAGGGRVVYVIAAVVVFVLFLVVYVSVLRNSRGKEKKPKKKDKEDEKEDENGVDLEEFFQKK